MERGGGEEEEERIRETVLEILSTSNMNEVTEFIIRKTASDKLGLDLSVPHLKKFVRQVVESYLSQQADKTADEEEEEDQIEEEDTKRKRGDKEYNDDGDLIICRVSYC